MLAPDDDARESFAQARQALQEQRYDRAELLLERTLMLQPDNAEARIELALLMARRGQADTARALLAGLAEDPRTPPVHRQRLLQLIQGLAPGPQAVAQGPAPPRAQPLWRAEAGLAWSTNPLARTSAQEIAFTTPDGTVPIALTGRPVQGAVGSLALSRVGPQAGMELALQAVDAPGLQPAARWAAWGPAPSGWDLAALQWSLSAQQGVDGARRHLAGLSWAGPQHRWSVFRYSEPSLADRGHLLRLEVQAAQGLPPGAQALVSLERSSSTLKDQGTWRMGLQAQAQLPSQLRLQAQWSGQKDLHAYSPLLANGAPRWLSTLQLALERPVSWGSGKTLTFRVLTTERKSNIELFAYRESALQLQFAQMWR